MTTQELKEKYPTERIVSDRYGKPSVMVWIPKFYMNDVIDGASHTPHPAFLLRDRELDGIYISKFQNVVRNGCAYSLPNQDPCVRIDFDTADRVCRAKGEGFHLMTAMEWGAIALWCQSNGWLPFGNNGMGRDIRETQAIARISYLDEANGICRTATGTGPVEWSHNRQSDGIYDLNANVWEWVGGLRLVNGEVQILQARDCAANDSSQSFESEHWRAIDGLTGECLIPNESGTTENSVKLDFVEQRWCYIRGRISNSYPHHRYCYFSDVAASADICERAREILYALGCLPSQRDYDYHGVAFYANNGVRERMAFRGGRWGQGLNSGLFKTCFDDARNYAGEAVGFRSAYYEWL